MGKFAPKYTRGEVVDQNGQLIGMSLDIKNLVKTITNDTYEYVATSANTIFESNKAQYFEKFRIKWEWSNSVGVNKIWHDAGISENPLYLTYDKPKQEEPAKGYLHFYTLLHIGCKYGDGATNTSDLIDKIWEYFVTKNVRLVNGNPLLYYGQWSGGNLATNTRELLSNKDGMCMAWTRLLLDVLKAQGYQEDNNAIFAKPRVSNYLFIKNWVQTVPSGTSGNSEYPFKNIAGTPIYLNNMYNWTYKEVTLDTPSSSQNNLNPQSDFGNHIFAKIKGKLYDPSYGVTYGLSTMITDPLDPLEMIEVVPELDNFYISAYSIKPLQDGTHFIQINTINTGDIMVIDPYQTLTH